MTSRHVPVMASEVLGYLLTDETRVVVDATLGAGGHAEAILRAAEHVNVVGIDRDRDALGETTRRLSSFGARFRAVCARFSEIESTAEEHSVDGVFADLGVSSMQLDDAGRGFSYRGDGPLDMRMGGEGETARELIGRSSDADLAVVLREYGEVPRARRLAAAVKRASEAGELATTGDLRRVVESALGPHAQPAALSRVFQAFRIAVNGELDELAAFLAAATRLLSPTGRIVVISYHSLEDRMVKQFFREQSRSCVCPPEAPVCTCGRTPVLRLLTRKAVMPGAAEVENNPRARSARLRAAAATGNGGAN